MLVDIADPSAAPESIVDGFKRGWHLAADSRLIPLMLTRRRAQARLSRVKLAAAASWCVQVGGVRYAYMRLLVVEDEATIADFLVRGLTEHGYAVDLAGDGRRALEFLATGSFDVVVLDILMPEIDGLTVCRRMRDEGDRTPVLLLTARDTVEDRVTGLDAGADDYLVKPFAFAELVARVRALSRREPALTNPILRIADLELDTTTREATRSGRSVSLTAKEYALLEYLMRNPNRVLTRTMISERVWNYETFNVANVIDVYIGHLRRKIDDGQAIRLIHTVRGAGYKIGELKE